MNALISFQQERHEMHMRWKFQKFRPQQTFLPKSMGTLYAPLGVLNLSNGTIVINSDVKSLLKVDDIWREFKPA